MRVDPAAFRALDLRVHRFLEDVPLHDVWRVELRDIGEPADIQRVRDLLWRPGTIRVGGATKVLFAVREWLGRLFGWDREPIDTPQRSYLSRLTDTDRAQTLVPPGTAEGPFRVMYVFPSEAVSEVINRTVHAFSCFALVPGSGEGHLLYWAVYVRPVGVVTRAYMALIDPFRRWVVYPSILRRIQRGWEAPLKASAIA